jgi:hypothetical protein
MSIAVVSSSSGGYVIGSGKKPAVTSFQDFRILSRLQPLTVAARLVRLSRSVEMAIRKNQPNRFARARWLEEAVAYIAQSRSEDADSQALMQCLTRLLRQSFNSLDWRRPLIAGLTPARNFRTFPGELGAGAR